MAGLLQALSCRLPEVSGKTTLLWACMSKGAVAHRDPGWEVFVSGQELHREQFPGLLLLRPAGAQVLARPQELGGWRGALEILVPLPQSDTLLSSHLTVREELNYTSAAGRPSAPRFPGASSRTRWAALGPPRASPHCGLIPPRPSICPFLPISCHRLSPELLCTLWLRGAMWLHVALEGGFSHVALGHLKHD